MKNIFTKILDCFFLLRIPLLAPVWTILILGWITADPNRPLGGIWGDFSVPLLSELPLWIALVGFSLVVASIYVINQIVDIESDRINHKLFLLPHGFISVRTAWILAACCALAGMATAFYFNNTMVILFGLGLVLGGCYNLKPVILKNRPWGGVFANFLGHGVLTYLVGWYAARQTLDTQALLSSLSPGFANAAVFLASTIPDASGDRATGKKTFCVRYGEKATAIVAAVACLLALVFCFKIAWHWWVMGVPAIVSMFFFALNAVRPKKEMAFQSFKWPVFILTAFVSLMVPLYAVLILITYFGSKLYYRKRFGIDYPTFKSQ